MIFRISASVSRSVLADDSPTASGVFAVSLNPMT